MRRLATAFAQLVFGSVLGQLIGFAVLIVVARRIGPSSLGAYGFANSLIPYFIVPLAGLAALVTRDIARAKPQAAELVGAVIPTLLVYSIGATALLYVAAPAIAATAIEATMIRILAVSIVLTILTFDWVLLGLQEFKRLALARLIGQVAYGLVALTWLTSGVAEAYRYAWLNNLGLAVTLVAVSFWSVRLAGRPKLHVNLATSVGRLRRSIPFTTSYVMIKIYYSADFVLLGLLSTSTAVGQYVVAYKIPLVLLGFSSLWSGIIYPHAASQRRDLLRHDVGLWTTVSFVLLLPLCSGGILLAHPLITTAFGSSYAPAAPYFRLLMASVPLSLVNGMLAQVLTASDHERAVAQNVAVGAGANVALLFLLIPTLGPQGAALSTIAAEATVFALLLVRTRKAIGVPAIMWYRVASAVASAAMMILALLSLFTAWSVWLRVIFGAVVFCTCAAATGVVRLSDRGFISAARETRVP